MYLSIPFLFIVSLLASTLLPGNALSSPSSSVEKSTRTQLFTSQGNGDTADDSTSMSIDCAIIGGGPASFVTAIAISKASPSSSIAIFEKDAFQPKGASIQISKSGWKSIKELEESLVQKLDDTGVPVYGVGMKPWKYSNDDNAEDNQNSIQVFLKKNLSKVKSKAMRILFSRAIRKTHLWHDVRVALRDHAIKTYDATEAATSGDRSLLNLNCALEEIHPLHNDDKDGEDIDVDIDRFELTLINTQNGERKKVRAKYLFACDGTKSKVRSVLPNEPDILLAENKSVWRGMAPNVSTSGKATFFIGKGDSDTAGRSALLFPGGKDAGSSWTVISDVEDGKSTSTEEARNRVLKVIDTMGMSAEASTTESGSNEYVQLKQAIDDSFIIIENKLHVRDFDKPWESAYDGLIYIGDSAHPVRPTGEGTALAFEDANVLGQVISKHGLGVRSLREYENERYEAVKTISEKVRASSIALYKPNGQAP